MKITLYEGEQPRRIIIHEENIEPLVLDFVDALYKKARELKKTDVAVRAILLAINGLFTATGQKFLGVLYKEPPKIQRSDDILIFYTNHILRGLLLKSREIHLELDTKENSYGTCEIIGLRPFTLNGPIYQADSPSQEKEPMATYRE